MSLSFLGVSPVSQKFRGALSSFSWFCGRTFCAGWSLFGGRPVPDAFGCSNPPADGRWVTSEAFSDSLLFSLNGLVPFRHLGPPGCPVLFCRFCLRFPVVRFRLHHWSRPRTFFCPPRCRHPHKKKNPPKKQPPPKQTQRRANFVANSFPSFFPHFRQCGALGVIRGGSVRFFLFPTVKGWRIPGGHVFLLTHRCRPQEALPRLAQVDAPSLFYN